MRTNIVAVVACLILLTRSDARAEYLPDVCGNVNGSDSGAVTTADALLVLKRSVGQETTLFCEAPGRPVMTGEFTDHGPGSDGATREGTARTFLDNGDGTITDYGTGLMWEMKDRAGGIHDAANVYTWSTGTNNMNGTIASGFLASLNSGEGFAGYTNWRIPNRFELESLLNLGTSNPATHFRFNRNCVPACSTASCSCTGVTFYWTSTSSTTPSEAWVVAFSDGFVTTATKTITAAVRAVRSVHEIPSNASCELPDPPQCTFNDPCTDGSCSITRRACSTQSDCPLSPGEQCCCSGSCL